jgi:hypothetical protein
MDHEFKVTLHIEWIVDATLASPQTPHQSPRPVVEPSADEGDESDESTVVVESVAGHLINEMFPGAEEVS